MPALQRRMDPNEVDAKLKNSHVKIVVPSTGKKEEQESAHTTESERAAQLQLSN